MGYTHVGEGNGPRISTELKCDWRGSQGVVQIDGWVFKHVYYPCSIANQEALVMAGLCYLE